MRSCLWSVEVAVTLKHAVVAVRVICYRVILAAELMSVPGNSPYSIEVVSVFEKSEAFLL